jgi:hypothetical protein
MGEGKVHNFYGVKVKEEKVADFEVLVAGKKNVYHLINGLVIYAEEEYVKYEGEMVVFDMRNCAVLTKMVGPRGEIGITSEKGISSPNTLWASSYSVRKDAIIGRSDTVNDGLKGNIRQVLSGLVLAKPER